MPFDTSKCDISIISFETNKINWSNITGYGYAERGVSTINKSPGSTFNINSGDVVSIASLDCSNDTIYNPSIDNIEYQLRLYSGYLEYGIYCTEGNGDSLVNARLTNIHLNIIARV